MIGLIQVGDGGGLHKGSGGRGREEWIECGANTNRIKSRVTPSRKYGVAFY